MIYSQYDEIASRYDDLFNDEKSIAENAEVGEMLPPLIGSILDIGCGTGLLTEIVEIEPMDYLGVDPSRGMLEQFERKHPEYKGRLINEPFNCKSLVCDNFDNIVSLFGSPSYLSHFDILAISKCKAKKFLMFYKEDYHPITYEKCNVELKHNFYSRKMLRSLFGENNVGEFNNYLIVKT